MPSEGSSRDYDLLDQLVEEFNERFRKGERPSIKEYCDRHPELADDLRELLPAMAQVEQAKDALAQEVKATSSAPALQHLGDFRILREVGHGGMGVVYEAEQLSLGRRVALKVLTDRLLREERQKRRFEREARAAARLHHTNIVPVFGTGEAEGVPYYVMQYIQGMGLDVVVKELARMNPSGSAPTVVASPVTDRHDVSQIARSLLAGEPCRVDDAEVPEHTTINIKSAKPIPPALAAPGRASSSGHSDDQRHPHPAPSLAAPGRGDTSGSTSSVILPGQSGITAGGKTQRLNYWQSVARIGAQVADALDHAHKQGILHRDIKPSNLLLDMQGTVWVTDFGLAKAEGADNLTCTGDVLGTLRYMPPEAFDGKADHRGDLYSLGLTLYEVVALRPAFDERERNRLIKQVTTGEPAPVGRVRRGVPRDLETIISKAIDRDPGRRYQTAADLRDDLQRFVDDEPIQARRQSQWERARRWARHHPAVAALLALVFLSLSAGVAVSSILAIRADEARAGEARRAKEAEEARQTALAALAEADAARDAAQREVVKFDLITAAQQAERGEPELALHWVARAWQDDQARLKPGQHLDAGAEANHRLRLAAAIDRLPHLVGFCPHNKPVADADCDPTGDRVVTVLATLTQDKSGAEFWTEQREHVARVWNAGRAELAYPPLVHGGPVTSAVFSADGTRIATSSLDGSAAVWEAASGKRLHLFRPGGPIARVAFSPDGKTLAAAVGQTVQRWDLASGEPAGEAIAVGGPTDYVAYSPEGSKLVSVTLAGKAQVWDAATGKALSTPLPFFRFGEKEFRRNINFIQPMEWQRWPAFSADGKQLATADGFRIHLWSEAGTKVIATHAERMPKQIQVAFNPTGTQLVYVARRDHQMFVHDLAAGKVVAVGKTGRFTCGLAVSPDGKRAAVPVSAGSTMLFDLPSAAVAGPSLRIPAWVTRAQFTRDSQRLLTASWDGTVRIWQPASWFHDSEPYSRDCGRADRLEFPGRCFSPDGTWVAAYDASKRQLRVGRIGGELIPLPRDGAQRCRFSPDGRHLATLHREGNGEGVVLASWTFGGAGPRSVGTTTVTGHVHDLGFSADGRRLGISVRSRTFKPTGAGANVDQFFVYDFPSLKPLLGPVGGDLVRLTGNLALGRDGSVLVGGQWGTNRLTCWDVRTGERLPGGRVGPGDLYSIDVGLQDERVVVPASDGTITQWDVRAGRRAGPTISLPGIRSFGFGTATWSPDQTRIAQTAAGKAMTRMNLFSALDGNLLATIYLKSNHRFPDVWFSVDGRRVIVHQRGTTHVWAWTLPTYAGALDKVPALIRLITGTGSDPVGGLFPLTDDAIRSEPETYRHAFRAWKGLADGGGQ
jgi:serine/threonine protein kinase/WD40 repeat protein